VTLTREDVVRAGAELLDVESVEKLSMRRLARHLGTGPATLYWHVRDKDELLLLILDDTLRDVVISAEGSWQERLTQAIVDSHEMLLPRPALIDVLWGAAWELGPATLRLADGLVALVAESGLPEAEVGDAYVGLITLLFGFVSGERSSPGNPSYTELRTRAHFTEGDEPVDVATAYPHLVRYGPDATLAGMDRRLRYAIGCFIAGLEARVREARRGRTASARGRRPGAGSGPARRR